MPYKLNAFTGELDRTQRSIDATFEIKTDNGSAFPENHTISIVGGAEAATVGVGSVVGVAFTGGGGGGVEFADDEFRVFNAVNTTAKIAHDLSSIDIGATRVIKDANYDIDMSTLASSFTADSGVGVPIAGGTSLTGGAGINTLASGSQILFSADGEALASVFSGNFGFASPSGGEIEIVGVGDITVAGTGKTLTINSSGGAGDYVDVATNDLFIPAANEGYLSCDTTNFDIQIQLPDTDIYRNFTVKDRTGNASIRNIIVTTASGNIDGKSSFILSANNESETFIFNGSNYEVRWGYKDYHTYKGFVVGSSSTHNSDFNDLKIAIDKVPDGSVIYVGEDVPISNNNTTINKRVLVTSFYGTEQEYITLGYTYQIYADVTFVNLHMFVYNAGWQHHSGNATFVNCIIERHSSNTNSMVRDYSSDGDLTFSDCLFVDPPGTTNRRLFEKFAGSTSAIKMINCRRRLGEDLDLGTNGKIEINDGVLILDNTYTPYPISLLGGTLSISKSTVGHVDAASNPCIRMESGVNGSEISDSKLISSSNQSVVHLTATNISMTNTHCIRNSPNVADIVLDGTGTIAAANVYFGIPQGVAAGIVSDPIYIYPRDLP
jgi:hypothetical protein